MILAFQKQGFCYASYSLGGKLIVAIFCQYLQEMLPFTAVDNLIPIGGVRIIVSCMPGIHERIFILTL